MTIAIIGAGIAGAACAARLVQLKQDVVVFDKGRSAGGRMSSKRSEDGYLDLGAQYFTARTPTFSTQCQHWLAQGVIGRWCGKLASYQAGQLTASPDDTERFIGVPSMQRPVQQLLTGITVKQAEISAIKFANQSWQLFSGDSLLGQFEYLVLAVPQQQAERLCAGLLAQQPDLAALFACTALLPCWAVSIPLLNHYQSPSTAFDGIFVKDDASLSWLARQGSKPGRAEGENWLVHFNPAWSQAHLEDSAGNIATHAAAALKRVLNVEASATDAICHRWRYAQQAPDYAAIGVAWLPELALGLCGDWLNGGRVENAWLSGVQLAEELTQ